MGTLRQVEDELKKSRPIPRGKKRVEALSKSLVSDGKTVPPNFTSLQHLECVLQAYSELSNPVKMAAFRKSELFEKHGNKRRVNDVFLSEL